MRPQNNKNRMRGRGRKPSNPLNRNYESNGPDVKIRGNASHIAEKYATLARDALSSGDRVMAENYLQHAEHYNRIVLAANAQREDSQQASQNRQPQSDDRDDDGDDDMNSDIEASATRQGRSDDHGDDDQDSGKSRRRPRRRDANGNAKANDGGAETAAEAKSDNDGKSSASGAEDESPAPAKRRTSRKKAAASEPISSDAASLPQGLIGDIPETASADK